MKKEIIELLDLIASKIPSLNTVNFKKTIKTLARSNVYPAKDLVKDLVSIPDQLQVVQEILSTVKTFTQIHQQYVDEWTTAIKDILDKLKIYRVQTKADLSVSLPNIFPAECKLPSTHPLVNASRTPAQLDKRKKRTEKEDTDDHSEQEVNETHSALEADKTAGEFKINDEFDDLIYAAVVGHTKQNSREYRALKKGAAGYDTDELKLKVLIPPPDRYKYETPEVKSNFGKRFSAYTIWRCRLDNRSIKNVAYKPHPITADFLNYVEPYKTARRSFPEECETGSVIYRGHTIVTILKKIEIIIREKASIKEKGMAARATSITKQPADEARLATSPQEKITSIHQDAGLSGHAKPSTSAKPAAHSVRNYSTKNSDGEETSEDNTGKTAKKPAATLNKPTADELSLYGSFGESHPTSSLSAPLLIKPAHAISLERSHSTPLSPNAVLPPIAKLLNAPASPPPSSFMLEARSHTAFLLNLQFMKQQERGEPEYGPETPEYIAPAAAATSLLELSTLHRSHDGVLLPPQADQKIQPPLTPLTPGEVITVIDDPLIISLLEDDEDLKKEREIAEKRLAEQQKAADAAAILLAEELKAKDVAENELKAAARERQRKIIAEKNAKLAQLQQTTEQTLKNVNDARRLTEMYKRKSSLLFSGNSANTSAAASPAPASSVAMPIPSAPAPENIEQFPNPPSSPTTKRPW